MNIINQKLVDPSVEPKNLLDSILSCPETKIIEILSENSLTCMINILGETSLDKKEPKQFVLKLHKKEFSILLDEKGSPKIIELLQKIFSSSEKYFENDIYHKFLTKDIIQNQVDVELIYPATQKQIDKYRLIKYEIFHETYEAYLKKTLPYINSIQQNDVKWIFNIFEKKTEEPIGEAPSKKFIILKDYTTTNDSKTLICLGIPIPEYSYIKSVRDLTQKELPLLQELYTEGKKIIAKKYNCKVEEIKAFLHYPPSFYYLHVHYLSVNDPNLTISSSVNRAIDLNEIIENIKMKNDYYQTIAIDHTIQVNSKLYKALFDN